MRLLTESDHKLLKSYHIFIFPFSFKIEEYDSFKEFIEDHNWEISSFCPKDKYDDYNEFNYFNTQARNIIYQKCTKNCSENCNLKLISNDENYYCTKKLSEHDKYHYIIETEKATYSLEISEISIKIYEFGIGILSIHLNNFKYAKTNQILEINQYGRRLFKPYIKNDPQKSCPLIGRSISIKFDNSNEILASTDYDGHNCKDDSIPKLIKDILYNDFSLNNNNIPQQSQIVNENLKIFTDDRMFVVCFYKNNFLMKGIQNNKKTYIDKWYSFLFVDVNKPSCSDEEMKEKILREHSYRRWLNDDTIYGITDYSFVCLSVKKCESFVLDHIRTMYYQMIILTFVQKISILNFKNRIGQVLNKSSNSYKDISTMNLEIEKLQEDYIIFTNKICLDSLTLQQQGIEMYNMMKKIMNVSINTIKLKEEIQDLFNLYVFKNQQIENEESQRIENKLNIIATIGTTIGISSLLTSIMTIPKSIFLIYFQIITIVITFLTWIFISIRAKSRNIYITISIILLIILLFLLVAMFYITYIIQPI